MSFDPLAGVSDTMLYNVQLLLALTCGRSKSQLRDKRREILCSFNQVLKPYSESRGVTPPAAPYHPGDLKA